MTGKLFFDILHPHSNSRRCLHGHWHDQKSEHLILRLKMQLDVDMSPPANIMTVRWTLTHVSFDLDPVNFDLQHYM